MIHDDEEDSLARVNLHTWRVPPPPAAERASILARVLAPAIAPRRTRGLWLIGALALSNVVLAAIIVIIISQRPAQPTVTVRPAGGGDPQTEVLLRQLAQEEQELQDKLVEVQQLAQKVRDCDQTVHRPPPPHPAPPPAPSPPPTTPSPPPPPSPMPESDASCDEVSCVLNNNEGQCCAKYRHGAVPDTLDRSAISTGVAAVKGQVQACGQQSSAKGRVKVHVRVAANGLVTGVEIEATPDAALGACVQAAMRKARFAPTEQGGSFSYPFVF
jgi:TonB family protein